MRMSKAIILTGLLLAAPVVAFAAGTLTNGLPTPSTTYYAPNGQLGTSGNSLSTYSGEAGGYELYPNDTNLGNGAQPQSLAFTTFQGGALAAAAAINTFTITSGAATNNGTIGVGNVTTAAAIAAGGSLTITLTNSSVVAASKVQVAAYLGVGAGVGGAIQIVSVTPASGSVVIVLKNIGSAAIGGTGTAGSIYVPFQVQ